MIMFYEKTSLEEKVTDTEDAENQEGNQFGNSCRTSLEEIDAKTFRFSWAIFILTIVIMSGAVLGVLPSINMSPSRTTNILQFVRDKPDHILEKCGGNEDDSCNLLSPTPASTKCFDNEGLRAAVDLWFSNRERAEEEHGAIESWPLCHATDFQEVFERRYTFHEDLTDWDTSRVTSMDHLFHAAESFNGDISDWDTQSVTSMVSLFADAVSFNGDLSGWDTYLVESMQNMLLGAKQFDGDLSNWSLYSVTNMYRMFAWSNLNWCVPWGAGDLNKVNTDEIFEGTNGSFCEYI